jgi:hypothetical protein
MANRGANENVEQKAATENLKKDASQVAGGADAVEGPRKFRVPKPSTTETTQSRRAPSKAAPTTAKTSSDISTAPT